MQVVEVLHSQTGTTRNTSTETGTQPKHKYSIKPSLSCVRATIPRDKECLQKEMVVIGLSPEQSRNVQNKQGCSQVVCNQSINPEYLQKEASSNPYVKEGIKRSFEKIDKLNNSEEFSPVTLSQHCFLDYLQTEKSSDAFEAKLDKSSHLERKEYFNLLKLSCNSNPQNSVEVHTQIHIPIIQRTEGSALASREDCRQTTYNSLRQNQTSESSIHENKEDYEFLQPSYEIVYEGIKETRISNIQTTERNIAENREDCSNVIHIYDNQKNESGIFESIKGYTLLQMSYNSHSESITDIQKSSTQTSQRNVLENSEEHSLLKPSYCKHPKNITEIQVSSTQKTETRVDEHRENCGLPITSYGSVLENLKEIHTSDDQTTVAKYDKCIIKDTCNFDITIAALQSSPCERKKLLNAEESSLLSNNSCLVFIKQLRELVKNIVSQHIKAQAEKRAGVVKDEEKSEYEGGLQKNIKISRCKKIHHKLVNKKDGKQSVLVERVNETKRGVEKIKNSEITAASRRTSLRESVSLFAMNEIC